MESTINDVFDRNRLHQQIERLRQFDVLNGYSDINKPIEIMKGNELDITITDRDSSYGDSRIYRYKVNGESVLRFDQIPYPECCGIAIIKNFACNSDLSKADFTEAMTKFTEDLVANDRFSRVLFYTTRGSNGDRYFQQFDGITILDSFQNRRSGNMLIGFEIDLLKLQPEPEKILLPYEDDDFDEPTEGDDAVASDLDIEIQLAGQRREQARQRFYAASEAIASSKSSVRSTQSSVVGQYGLDTGNDLPNMPLNTGDGIMNQIERNSATSKARGTRTFGANYSLGIDPLDIRDIKL